MYDIVGSLNSIIWLLIVIVFIAVIIWAVRMAFAPGEGRTYREQTFVRQPAAPQAAPSSGLTPGWYPDQNDHAMMRYYDGRVWTSETRSG